MRSEKTSSADNQQETNRTINLSPQWLTGFVDGEGCFSVRIIENMNATRSGGWTFGFSFSVSQHHRAKDVLEEIARLFGCGRVSHKAPNSNVWVYNVTSTKSIESAVLPFFDQHPLVVKKDDYETFRRLVHMFRAKQHFTEAKFNEMAKLAYSMNDLGRQRRKPLSEIVWKGSSETIRQARDLTVA